MQSEVSAGFGAARWKMVPKWVLACYLFVAEPVFSTIPSDFSARQSIFPLNRIQRYDVSKSGN